MAGLRAEVYVLLHKLRKKYGEDKKLHDALDKVVWWSFPVVYYNFNDDVKVIRKDYHAICEHRRKVRNYIRGMVATFPKIFLVSLTFSDDYIECKENTLKDYARKWLNAKCDDYYACVDYGKKSGRVHYHSVCAISWDMVLVENVKSKNKGKFLEPKDIAHKWIYGFSSFRPLWLDDDSNVYKVLNYAFKASSYSFKCADRKKIKPFHKRGVDHWDILENELPLL